MCRDAAVAAGVPPERILLETAATNTAENFRFSPRRLAEAGLEVPSIDHPHPDG